MSAVYMPPLDGPDCSRNGRLVGADAPKALSIGRSGNGRVIARCWVLRATSVSGTGRVFYFQRDGSGSCSQDARRGAREFASAAEADGVLAGFHAGTGYRVYRRGRRAKVSPVAEVIAALEANLAMVTDDAEGLRPFGAEAFSAGTINGLSFAVRELRKVEGR